MSLPQISRNQITKEIDLIPEENRQELYEIIHNFRINLQQENGKANEIMKFAGSWLDIPEEDFNDFCEDIKQRRQAFSSRRVYD